MTQDPLSETAADAPRGPDDAAGWLKRLQRFTLMALVVLLVLLGGLIVFASYKLSGLLGEIRTQQRTMENNNAVIKSQEAAIASQNSTIAKQKDAINAVLSTQEYRPGWRDANVNAGGGTALKARVYIQIGDAAQRARAQEVSRQLEARGYVVPGIENISGKAKAPPVSQLRFYGADDAARKDVDDIVGFFQGIGVALKTVQLPASGGVRPRHYEIWFGDDFRAY
jgi:type II secretory pathway pseudopilin PulG